MREEKTNKSGENEKKTTQTFQRTSQASHSTEPAPKAHTQTKISKQHCLGAHESETGQKQPDDKVELIWKAWQVSQPTPSQPSIQINLKIQA